jgi:HEAT repeat protein
MKTRKVSAAVPAISKLVADASVPPFVRLEACDALADLAPKAGSWKPACCGFLLTSGDDTMIRVRAAGVLARTGDARGWPLVSEKLASPERGDVEGGGDGGAPVQWLVAPGARDKTPINVPLAAAQAFGDASEASQSLLVGPHLEDRAAGRCPGAVEADRRPRSRPTSRTSLSAVVAKLGRP